MKQASGKPPNLRHERALLAAGHVLVAGVDEVGRGSLGGPVSVGVVVVGAGTGRPPPGLRDSKLLSPAAREALVPRIVRWAHSWAVGHASAAEIDDVGILRALRLAGERALVALSAPPDAVVLDGNYDWLTRPAIAECSPYADRSLPDDGPGAPGALHANSPPFSGETVSRPGAVDRVELRAKADSVYASVAAASVLAKVTRDAMMTEMACEYPAYGWHANKGYAAPAHLAALAEIGPCPEHRLSWRLPALRPGDPSGGPGPAPR